jgi:hypothetical protein
MQLQDSIAHRARILSCFSLGVGVWFIARLVFPTFQLFFPIFSTTFRMQFELFHPSIASISQCVCTHPINPMGIHLLCCVHDNKCTRTHDVICDTFGTIVQDVDFHVRWEQLHVPPSNTFNSSCWQVDIVLTKDGIRTLVDDVNAKPTWVDLFLWSCVI